MFGSHSGIDPLLGDHVNVAEWMNGRVRPNLKCVQCWSKISMVAVSFRTQCSTMTLFQQGEAMARWNEAKPPWFTVCKHGWHCCGVCRYFTMRRLCTWTPDAGKRCSWKPGDRGNRCGRCRACPSPAERAARRGEFVKKRGKRCLKWINILVQRRRKRSSSMTSGSESGWSSDTFSSTETA